MDANEAEEIVRSLSEEQNITLYHYLQGLVESPVVDVPVLV